MNKAIEILNKPVSFKKYFEKFTKPLLILVGIVFAGYIFLNFIFMIMIAWNFMD